MLVRLFGPPRIEGPTGAVIGPASQRHRLALIALLVQSPRHVLARERLIGLLWPETAAAIARQLLSVSVYELRKVFGDGVLLSEGATLRIDTDHITADAIEFEQARARGDAESAEALYVSPFLEGFVLPGAMEFEHWAELERERLERRYQAVLEQLGERYTVIGDHCCAVDWWRQRLARTPEDGRIVRRLMEALEHAGDRAGALHVATLHTSLLRREFGAEPDLDVAALATRLRHGAQVALPAGDDHH